MIEYVVLTDVDEKYAPPEQNVLRVAVVGDQVFLSVSKLDENHTESNLVTIAEIAVDIFDLSDAIMSGFNASIRRKERRV